ncbi:MAG: hypothetical protein LBR38_00475 [Synergistaceae bacterium]|jgi:hypothetical protein|nr:hypothetical protein [Synergistaceae bacterium]
MHFEFLVEDRSSKTAIDILFHKIVGEEHTHRIHPYSGTWELLAEAIYEGGYKAIVKQNVGAEKSKWAASICPKMNVNDNKSPSFNFLCVTLRELADSKSAASRL